MPVPKTMAAAVSPPESDPGPISEDVDGFSPGWILSNAFRLWWVILALTLAGGALGLLFHRLNPPVYEATGRFSASIDFVLTGPLTQFEEDTALNKIGDLIGSQPVLDAVVEQAAAEGMAVTATDLRRMAVIERRLNTWDLRVRHTDPVFAGRIASIWVDEGQAILLDSYEHALRADSLNRSLRSLENCLAVTAASEPSHALCSRARFSEIQADLAEAGAALYQERIASRGLFAGLTIGPADAAVVGERPVLYRQNQLVLAGGLLGMLLGIGLVESVSLARRAKRN